MRTRIRIKDQWTVWWFLHMHVCLYLPISSPFPLSPLLVPCMPAHTAFLTGLPHPLPFPLYLCLSFYTLTVSLYVHVHGRLTLFICIYLSPLRTKRIIVVTCNRQDIFGGDLVPVCGVHFIYRRAHLVCTFNLQALSLSHSCCVPLGDAACSSCHIFLAVCCVFRFISSPLYLIVVHAIVLQCFGDI